MFNKHSRRHFLKVGGGLLVGVTTTGSFPLLHTLAAGRPKNILSFQFTLEGGGKGSFYLDTTAESTIGQGMFGTEFSYFSAVSNFSLSKLPLLGLYSSVKNENATWKVIPGVTAENLGFPPGTPGVLSGVNYPDRCSVGTGNFCSITIAVLYSGNLAELPNLSANPHSYQLIGADLFDSNGQLINRIRAIKSKIIALPGVIRQFKLNPFWH